MKKKGKAHHYQRSGFLLFELLIALVIFTFSAGMITDMYQCSMYQYRQAVDRLEAVTLAVNHIETWKASGSVNEGTTQREKYTVSCSEDILGLPGVAHKAVALLSVDIMWQDVFGYAKNVTFFSGKEVV